jgi:aldose 1-epimerase
VRAVPLVSLAALALAFAFLATQGPSAAPGASASAIPRQGFGRMPDGTAVDEFTLTNRNGLEIKAITYGAIIRSLRAPDRTGAFADIVHGFDSLDGYLAGHPYFGAVIGRYGNRIGGARFSLDGKTYELAANNGPNHLHGGVRGFDKHVWRAERLPQRNGIVFTRTSPDGEEGYPGTLQVQVTYTLSDANELAIEYGATTDKATPINLTNHSYFNLGGHDSGDILGHEVTIHAGRFTPVDGTLIPAGAIAPVQGTPFDFRRSTAVGARINDAHEQLKHGRGYDHNFVLDSTGNGLRPAARVMDPKSGRTLEVATTEPGVQFYTGNFLDGSVKGKGGTVYNHRTALCLETQHFPDSPNKPHFPSTILRPGDRYRSRTVFTFGVAR